MEGSVKVLITGAAGQIGYSLIPLVASGQVFGENRRVQLHLLDIPFCEESLKGVVMEVEDCSYPLVDKVVSGTNALEVMAGVNVAIFLGGFPRKQGMERKDLIAKNCAIFKEQGKALNEVADPNVKCLVVANPANTNCLLLSENAPRIPRENFSCLTRLDHNRALAQLSLKSGRPVSEIQNVIIWGNHSSTQYPDVYHGKINGNPIRSVIEDQEFLNTEFVTTVQKRGAAIIEARKLSSAMSAANAIKDHLKSWSCGTKPGEFVSMGILTSNDLYGVENGLCYSMPVTCQDFTYTVVQNLPVNEFSREKMNATMQELLDEKRDALECLAE